MGKGKGLIERKIIKIRRGVTLFEFKGVSKHKLI
jgi:ribosomal protein L16/L10AE